MPKKKMGYIDSRNSEGRFLSFRGFRRDGIPLVLITLLTNYLKYFTGLLKASF